MLLLNFWENFPVEVLQIAIFVIYNLEYGSFDELLKALKNEEIAGLVHYCFDFLMFQPQYQKRIHNPVKHLKWSFRLGSEYVSEYTIAALVPGG